MTEERREHVWRALHSLWVDGVYRQSPDNAEAIQTLAGGLDFASFLHLLSCGVLRITALPSVNDQQCVGIEICTDHGWQLMKAVRARNVGIADEVVERALSSSLDSAIERLQSEASQ